MMTKISNITKSCEDISAGSTLVRDKLFGAWKVTTEGCVNTCAVIGDGVPPKSYGHCDISNGIREKCDGRYVGWKRECGRWHGGLIPTKILNDRMLSRRG